MLFKSTRLFPSHDRCGGTTTPHCHNIRAVNCRVEDIPGQQMVEELDCVTIGNNLVDLNNNKSYREGNGVPYTYQIGTPAQYFTNHSGYIMWEVIESTPEYDTTLPITNLDVGDCTPTGIIPNKKEPLPAVPDIREMIENSDNLMKKIVKKMLK